MKILHIVTMAALSYVMFGCKSKEEIELEKQKLEVEKMQLELQKQVLQTMVVSDKSKAQEIMPVAKQYETLQLAYIIGDEKMGKSFDEIGFVPPSKSSYKYEKIENGMMATLIDPIGNCPAGSKWTTTAKRTSGNIEFTRTISDIKCEDLTPNYTTSAVE